MVSVPGPIESCGVYALPSRGIREGSGREAPSRALDLLPPRGGVLRAEPHYAGPGDICEVRCCVSILSSDVAGVMRGPIEGLDVVIVAYRCRDHLRRCLASVERHAPARTHVWVVDNDSRDGTVELVRGEFPFVSLIESGENAGFARASNLGIAAGSAPYVLALNPDTELRENTLGTLLELMEEHPEVGIAGPRLEQPDGTFDHASRRSFPTLLGALGHFSGIGRRLEGGPLAQYRAPEVERGPVDAVNGAFMLIRREALDRVGAFDEGYWMYMEDLDLCFRFKEAGWVTWYEPSVKAVHVKGGSAGRRSPRLVLAFHSGMSRFYRAHCAPDAPRALAGRRPLGNSRAARGRGSREPLRMGLEKRTMELNEEFESFGVDLDDTPRPRRPSRVARSSSSGPTGAERPLWHAC